MTVKFLDLTGLSYCKSKLNIPDTSTINSLINTALSSFAVDLWTVVSSLPASGPEGRGYMVPDATDPTKYNVYTWEVTDNTTTPETYGWVQLSSASVSITIDTALDTTSPNAIANSAVATALNSKLNSADLVAITNSEIDNLFV